MNHFSIRADGLGKRYRIGGRPKGYRTFRDSIATIDAEGKRTVETFAPANMFHTIFRENDWNDYRIVAIGARVSVYVNGTLFSDLVDRESNAKDLSGKLALQLHSGPETRVEFRIPRHCYPTRDCLFEFLLWTAAIPKSVHQNSYSILTIILLLFVYFGFACAF